MRRFVKPVQEIELGGGGVATSMQGEPVIEVAGGLPVLADALAWLACSVRSVTTWDTADGTGTGSHVLVVGEVIDVGETDRLTAPANGDDAVLSMNDTRMNYGG